MKNLPEIVFFMKNAMKSEFSTITSGSADGLSQSADRPSGLEVAIIAQHDEPNEQADAPSGLEDEAGRWHTGQGLPKIDQVDCQFNQVNRQTGQRRWQFDYARRQIFAGASTPGYFMASLWLE
jgi:hypothetical protein